MLMIFWHYYFSNECKLIEIICHVTDISKRIFKYQQISIPNYSYELYAEVNILVYISDYPITANGCEKHLIMKMLMKTWDEYFYEDGIVDALA